MKNNYQVRIDYANGYSASVISKEHSYGGDKGLFEVAVLVGSDIVYDTPIGYDVIGYLTFEDVAKILKEIEALPQRQSIPQAQ